MAMLFANSALAAGDAGCGLGSLVISKNSKLLQLFALTTNGTFLSQVFGITSGTSGCTSSGLVMTDKEIDYFVEVNHDDLTREMAQGQGEKLSTLAVLHGCKSKQSQTAFSVWTQQSYEKILPTATTSSTEIVQNLKSQYALELKQNSAVAQACQGSDSATAVSAL